MNIRPLLLVACCTTATLLVLARPVVAPAATLHWTDWTSATVGTPGSAAGTITLPSSPALSVTYTGEVSGYTSTNNTYPSWAPATTFSGGTVDNAPTYRDIIGLVGGPSAPAATLTFSRPVVNPVMAIWSLGAGGNSASFEFANGLVPTLEGGGPSQEFGGSSITVSGNVVSGAEGNGVVQFTGTFSSLQWTNPHSEGWYGFTVGVPNAVPEPQAWSLVALGLATLVATRRRLRV